MFQRLDKDGGYLMPPDRIDSTKTDEDGFYTCPRCGRKYKRFPSLSRLDNKTYICPICGEMEAFEEYFDGKPQGKETWESEAI